MFRLILDELLVTTHGALAAIFLDYEGETVELVCDRDLSDHGLRILGAYQGIFLTRLRTLCANAGAGQPHRRAAGGVETHRLADAARLEDAQVEGRRGRGLHALQSQVVDHERERSGAG